MRSCAGPTAGGLLSARDSLRKCHSSGGLKVCLLLAETSIESQKAGAGTFPKPGGSPDLMAKFKYRLQKVFELRERKKKEQEQRVVEARKKVHAVELEIEEKKNEIRLVRQNMLTAHHTMMSAHDEFIHHLHAELDVLYQDLEMAKQELKYEMDLLIKAQAELEALIKHKEKAQEEWLEEEKKREMKMLDEVAGQRYFRNQQAQALELELELEAQRLLDE